MDSKNEGWLYSWEINAGRFIASTSLSSQEDENKIKIIVKIIINGS